MNDRPQLDYQKTLYKDIVISLIMSLEWSCVEATDEFATYIEPSHQNILTITHELLKEDPFYRRGMRNVFRLQSNK